MEVDAGQGSNDTGKKLLERILQNGKVSTSSNAANMAYTYFTSRVEGKRLQLGNPDRRRPVPSSNTLAHHQIQRRDQRLTRKKQISSNGKGKEKEKDDQKSFSRRERQRLGLETIDKDLSYEILAPIHQLWLGYIHRLLGFIDENENVQINQFQVTDVNEGQSEINLNSNNVTAFQTSLVKADFCGAPMRVTRALNPSLVGIEGLVAKETESTFIIVTKSLHPGIKKSKKLVKIIPKHSSVFSLQIPLPYGAIPNASPHHLYEIKVPLFGNQLCNNIQSRATRKFKARKTVDL